MIFFDSASPMPGSCSRSSLEALLMSSCFFIGLPAPPLASGMSLLAGGLVVVPAASAIGTETAPSANSSATNTAMSLVMGIPPGDECSGPDRSRRPRESGRTAFSVRRRPATGARPRGGRASCRAGRSRRRAAPAPRSPRGRSSSGSTVGSSASTRSTTWCSSRDSTIIASALDAPIARSSIFVDLQLVGDLIHELTAQSMPDGPRPRGPRGPELREGPSSRSTRPGTAASTLTATPMPQALPRPMLASLDEASLADPRFAYEPKYDGIRALAMVRTGGGPGAVRLWSRLGNDKTSQLPEIARALAVFDRKLKADMLLDAEIDALDQNGHPAGFQRLQGRIHLTSERDIGGRDGTEPVAFVAFDVLCDGHTDLTALPLTARRARLERIFGNTGTTRLRLSDFRPGDGRALYREVLARGWEGLVAKELDSPYQSGRRGGAWRKIKVVRRQECVVGGWTEGRGSRAHFGALLLGVWEGGALVHVGHTGTGFNERELARVAALLRPLETTTCPFATRPVANERPHWTRPEIVVEVGFTEWTADGMLRHPKYLGLRDDIHPGNVRRETTAQSTRKRREVEPWPNASGATGRLIEIGRASCRERV